MAGQALLSLSLSLWLTFCPTWLWAVYVPLLIVVVHLVQHLPQLALDRGLYGTADNPRSRNWGHFPSSGHWSSVIVDRRIMELLRARYRPAVSTGLAP
jgi:hypothetical protein